MLNKKWFTFFILLLLLIGCQKKEIKIEQKLTIQLPEEATSLDPNLTNETYGSVILNHLYEGLVAFDENGNIIPAACESYEIDEANQKFVFHLRRDLKWSNGHEMTVADYKNSWMRIFNTHNNNVGMLTPYIVNLQEYMDGEVGENEIGIQVLDPYTLEIRTKVPTPFLLEILAHSIFFPVKIELSEQDPTGWSKDPSGFVSNGPFYLKAYEAGVSILLEKNPYYRASDEVKLDTLEFVFDQNSEQNISNFLDGKLDGLYDATEMELNALLDEQVSVDSKIQPRTSFISINHDSDLMKNTDFRKALSIVINREELINDTLLGSGIATEFLVPFNYQIEGMIYRDFLDVDSGPKVSEALEIVRNLKRDKVYNDRAIRLYYSMSEENDKIVSFLKTTYENELGISLDAIRLSWEALMNALESDDYDMILLGWSGDYNHPMTFLSLFEPNGFFYDVTRWHDATYIALLEDYLKSTEKTEKLNLLHSIENSILSGYHIIPLYYNKNNTIMSSRIKGWYTSFSNLNLKNAWVE